MFNAEVVIEEGEMRRTAEQLLSVAVLVLVSGCALHNVKYDAYCKNQIAPTDRATVVHGSIDESNAILEQAALPHNTARQRFELECQAGRVLGTRLGSPDYVVIGEVRGGGNARASLATLQEAFCKRAAREGGDVVMIFNAGIEERPYSYTTPGYAQTNVYGSAYSTGNYAYGKATAYTTYTPGQTYSRVLYLPYGNGLVLKHVPGMDAKRAGLARLDDPALERALSELERLHSDKTVTFEQVMERFNELVGRTEAAAPADLRTRTRRSPCATVPCDVRSAWGGTTSGVARWGSALAGASCSEVRSLPLTAAR